MRKAAANRPSAPVDVLTRTEMVNCLFSKPARNSGPTEQVAGTSLSSTPQIRVQPRSHPAVPAVRMSSKESDSRMSVEQQIAQRSEERRVGKEWVSTFEYRWSPNN